MQVLRHESSSRENRTAFHLPTAGILLFAHFKSWSQATAVLLTAPANEVKGIFATLIFVQVDSCNEKWMLEKAESADGYCAQTCGRCSCPTEPPARSSSAGKEGNPSSHPLPTKPAAQKVPASPEPSRQSSPGCVPSSPKPPAASSGSGEKQQSQPPVSAVSGNADQLGQKIPVLKILTPADTQKASECLCDDIQPPPGISGNFTCQQQVGVPAGTTVR